MWKEGGMERRKEREGGRGVCLFGGGSSILPHLQFPKQPSLDPISQEGWVVPGSWKTPLFQDLGGGGWWMVGGSSRGGERGGAYCLFTSPRPAPDGSSFPVRSFPSIPTDRHTYRSAGGSLSPAHPRRMGCECVCLCAPA